MHTKPGYRWDTLGPLIRNITYRQVDYWIRTGRVRLENPQVGSGNPRSFTLRECLKWRVLDRIIAEIGLNQGGPAHGRSAGIGLPHEWIYLIWSTAASDVPFVWIYRFQGEWVASSDDPALLDPPPCYTAIRIDVRINPDWMYDGMLAHG